MGTVPFGQKNGDMSLSSDCVFGSIRVAKDLSQPIMNLPVRCTSRACRLVNGEARSQAVAMTAMASKNSGKPAQESFSTPANMWLVFCRRPVMNTITPCIAMKATNQANDRKWTDLMACRLSSLPSQPRLLAIAGLCIRPVMIETGAATNTVTK
ncbi:hypothetical protein [Caulobacter sp. DWR1-3-2b1]|uniref:hypothetical protein n=1 Tax=Caulobacter sp. DWR1-3-2b1 TaxID=2804670 RepID=UPI003CF39D1B